MSKKKSESRHLTTAVLAALELFWGAYASFMAGWLVSAIGRHPDLERSISDELVYHAILLWKGDMDLFNIALILLIPLTAISAIQLLLQKFKFGHGGDGMHLGRKIVRQHLIPLIVAAGSFVVGILGGKDWSSMKASAVMFLMVFVIAVMFRYFIDTTEPVDDDEKRD